VEQHKHDITARKPPTKTPYISYPPRPIVRTMYYRGLQKTASYTPIVKDAADRFHEWKRQK